MSYAKQVNDMTFSFSRLNSFCQCKYSWYKKYIEKCEGIGSYHAENGKLMHHIAEMVAKKELPIEDAATYYMDEYEYIGYETKKTTMENTFEKCLDFLCQTDWIDEEKYEILCVEKKYEFMVGKYKFVGYIDLLLRDKETNEIICCDYKSSNHFFKKNGEVLKNASKQFEEYCKQMYLYSKAVYEEYDEFPSKICWIHFKDEGKLSIIDFDEEEYKKALEWAKSTISGIKKEEEFLPTKDWFYCNNLCNFRNICEYMDDEREV